ncbi:histone-lysine N-methyltransferase SETMAR [Plakobranchus ocellatus]|uniref:Histone-lysine N-methyltransferase SETMAR n=1 Tax=Plakobranchus ocellatus TaxID=259542 RepID=A0AAV4C7C4_9GAST|nr:histone-lysine N-methyltransferase SETMAR [Plakobranchus ocellatus]
MFWDSSVMILLDFLPKGESVNADRYCETHDRLRHPVRRKRPGLLHSGVGGVGSTVACESALRSAGTILSHVRAPLPATWPDGGPESLRSPCCRLAIYKNSPCIAELSFNATMQPPSRQNVQRNGLNVTGGTFSPSSPQSRPCTLRFSSI